MEDSNTGKFYTLKGAPVNKLSQALDLSKPVQGDGYSLDGDEGSGYTLTLGNLIMELTSQGRDDDNSPIKLPTNGNVTIVLKDGTTTRLIAGNGNAAMLAPTSSKSREITIRGSGNLQLESRQAQDNAGVLVIHDGLIIAGGNIAIANTTINPTTSGIVCCGSLNIIGGKLGIKSNGPAIYAESGITLGSCVQIKTPEGADIGGFDAQGGYVDGVDNNKQVDHYTIMSKDGKPAKIVEIRFANPAPSSGGGDYTPSPVTVYNDPSVPNATVWLTGRGLSSSDLLITTRDPQGSAYKALSKLVDSDDVFAIYNIDLSSGQKSTGNAMHLTFGLNTKYAGQDFTLVHQKADGTYEYFYDTADAKGDLAFGPLYELSPFMLVKGTLAQTTVANG